jgi:sigma-B regulation protein RsbU (phosphoserine phosphatase)
VAETWDLREQGPLSALREGRAWSREASLGCDSVVAVALPGPTEAPLGVLVLRGRSGGRSYRTPEVKLLGSLASLASAFLRSDRAALESKGEDDREALAIEIRRLLAPTGSLEAPGLEVAVHAQAARQDGCDSFDLLSPPDGSCVLWMAHATPGGIGSALAVAAIRAILRTETYRGSDPESVLEYARATISADLVRSGHRTAAFLGSIDRDRSRIDYMNAGHAGPLLVRGDGTCERLDAGGPALGAATGAEGELGWSELRPGDVLVVSSADPADVRDASGGRFRLDRVADVVRDGRTEPVAGILARLLAEMASHRGGIDDRDVSVLVVRILPRAGDRRA